MYALGPWIKFCRSMGGDIGERLGRIVKGDLKTFEKIENWTYADKIKELTQDNGLSKSYLHELISETKTKADFESIRAYLTEKSGNLTTVDQKILLQKVESSIQQITDNEILRKIIDAAKEGALSYADKTSDSIADLLHYLI